MDTAYLLPATTYQVPIRLARKQTLNTIIEDENSGNDEEEIWSEEEVEDGSDPRERAGQPERSIGSASPVPSLTSSISSYYRNSRHSGDFDEMYDVSDDDSDISPSVMTSISTHSACSNESPPTSKLKQNPHLSLVIPSPSYWPTIQKIQTVSPPRPPKIPLSPAALSMLGHDLPTSSNLPSLDGSLNSDPLAGMSAPVTPDSQLHTESGEIWGQVDTKQRRITGTHKRRPEIRIHIDDGSGRNIGSGFSPEDHVDVHDFAIDPNRDFSDGPVLALEDDESDRGVQLPPDALDTLQHLSPERPLEPEFASPTDSEKEMEEFQLISPPRPSSADMTPISQTSDYSISGLSIPSPGGFFSSLGANARHTWCVNGSGSVPLSAVPPSSTTAEQFYKCPWNRDMTPIVEQVVEVDDNSTVGPPTARQLPPLPAGETQSLESPDGEVHQIALVRRLSSDYDDNYEKAIQETAEKSLDRTSVWLAAQTSYMAALRETYPVSDVGLGTGQILRKNSTHMRNDSIESPMKKAVRFLESEIAKLGMSNARKSGEGESIYYHAFQHIMRNRNRADSFRHRHTRSDSLQAARFCLPHEHIARLQGHFNIVKTDRPTPQRPISMMPGKEKEIAEQTAEQKVLARVERERQALEQVTASMWVIEAAKYLSRGRLLNSPAVQSLTKAPSISDIEACKVKSHPRVLDLGGQPSGDWAWHLSQEYTNANVFTATTTPDLDTSIRGPHNHRIASVPSLWQLPYPDNHFNAISARTLFIYLHTSRPYGATLDEYDLCLHECLRCLKPGGYLEFFIMDSEVVNAGSRGTAVSVEFGFNLKTIGYDPNPTKSFLGRVRRAGFDDIKRAWTFLPMGTPTSPTATLPETPPPDVSTFLYGKPANTGNEGDGKVVDSEGRKVEAVQGPLGSTADAAGMAGLVGSWAWERWMLKLQLEMGKEHLLEGVADVLEEGKYTGAGWRCLSGWARKPCGAGG